MKKVLAVLLAVIIFILPACNAKTPDNSGASEGTQAVTTASNGVAKTGLPIVTQKITLKGLVSKDPKVPDWNTHPAVEELEKRTNIHVEWDCVPAAGFPEKRNLLFASNSLPDIVMRAGISADLEAKYAATKQIVPLEGLFKDYAPYFSQLMSQDSSILKNIKSADGHVYTMPMLFNIMGGLVNKYWINTKWLTKLGLPMPTTTDELYQTLKAFVERDANGNGKKDELALSGPYKGTLYSLFRYFNGSWGFGKNGGMLNNYLDVDDNGKVRMVVIHDKFKNELEFFSKLWNEGLMDKEMFSQDTSQIAAKVTSDLVGFCAHGNNTQFLGTNSKDFDQPPSLKGPYGENYWINVNSTVYSNGTFAMTSVNKYPEATMRWIDYFFSEEGTILSRLGIEGKSYIKNSDGSYALMDNIKKDPTGLTQDEALSKWVLYSGGGLPQYAFDKIDQSAAQLPEIKKATERVVPNLIPIDKIPLLHFTAEESTKLGTFAQDIQSYIDENVINFVTGKRSLSTWDQYVAGLNKMDIKSYMEIYQAAYDRWKK